MAHGPHLNSGQGSPKEPKSLKNLHLTEETPGVHQLLAIADDKTMMFNKLHHTLSSIQRFSKPITFTLIDRHFWRKKRDHCYYRRQDLPWPPGHPRGTQRNSLYKEEDGAKQSVSIVSQFKGSTQDEDQLLTNPNTGAASTTEASPADRSSLPMPSPPADRSPAMAAAPSLRTLQSYI
ncbi:hypothetical protein B9Z55_026713 [Caenorhabditis nigoni]|uniref:Uncharacterized protein n=1 Tax=Caenorhabditis nigoni TaxID=1611254 RepID=A0A2G5SHG3_9PELO|nr:hypothetical protein B9Z55_026713 [Caenorhabditis nigoni]